MNSVKRALSTVLATAATVLIIYFLARRDLGTAGEVATVAPALATLLAYLLGLFAPKQGPVTFRQIRGQLADQIDETLGEADYQPAAQSYFLPPRLVQLDRDLPLLSETEAAAWTAAQYQNTLAGTFSHRHLRRAVIVGQSGVGKSTLALRLAHGLRHRRESLPLLLPFSNWNPEDEDFASWLDQYLVAHYPAIAAMGDNRMKQLLYASSGAVTFILDGLDELGNVEIGPALDQINQAIPVGCGLIVLTRPLAAGRLSTLTGSDLSGVLRLAAPEVRSVDRFVHFLVREDKALHIWGEVAQEVREDPLSRVAEVLRSPLLLDMALSTYQTWDEVRRFLAAIRESAGERAQTLLFRDYLRQRFRDAHWNPEMSLRRLVYIAHTMDKLETPGIAWWRISDAVPGWIFAVAATLSLAPAYWLSLLMPPGLTRGLAVGSFAGILIGLTRGRSVRSGAGASWLVAASIVGAIGTWRVGVATAAADAAEMSAAVAAFILLKNEMLAPQPTLTGRIVRRLGTRAQAPKREIVVRAERVERSGRAVLAVITTGLAAAGATELLHGCWPSATSRPFSSVAVAIAFAVAVAVMSARLLVPLSDPVRPSRVFLRSRGTRLGHWAPHVSAGISSAVAIGVAGGIVGTFHGGFRYGLTMTVFFGIVAGVPIGITGGVIRWLNQPVVRRVVVSPGRAFRNDGYATVGCLALVSLSSAAAIALLLGPLRFVVTDLKLAVFVTPPDGLLFGLTIGAVVACYYNAVPGFVVASLYLGLTGRMPWNLMGYFGELHRWGILTRIGARYYFRHDELRVWLVGEGESVPDSPPEARASARQQPVALPDDNALC